MKSSAQAAKRLDGVEAPGQTAGRGCGRCGLGRLVGAEREVLGAGLEVGEVGW